jgi:hypothetical protein
MLAAPNALIITGGVTTVMLALAVVCGPNSFELISALLFFTPAVVPVTFRETVQLEGDAAVAPSGRVCNRE